MCSQLGGNTLYMPKYVSWKAYAEISNDRGIKCPRYQNIWVSNVIEPTIVYALVPLDSGN